MRTAILSDIHANTLALDAILARLDDERIDRFISLGDVVGYGAEPEACVRRVRSLVTESVLGNHDAAVSGRVHFDFSHEMGEALVVHGRRELSRGNLDWLKRRPYAYREDDLLFSHGAPLMPEDYSYILSLDDATDLTPHLDLLPRLMFIGHSHIERAYRLWPLGATEIRAAHVVVSEPWHYLINVGSVGQPRDGDPRAAAAIYDDEADIVEFVRVPYDIDDAARRILDAGLPELFARRLFVGW